MKTKFLMSLLGLSITLYGANFDVGDAASLDAALDAASTSGDTITLTEPINASDLAKKFRPVNTNDDFSIRPIAIQILGQGNTISSNNDRPGLFVTGGTVSISDARFESLEAKGGDGGGGGGGGAGMGAAIFVSKDATVTIVNPFFNSNRAQGGTGGTTAFDPMLFRGTGLGGGGGLGGNGGEGIGVSAQSGGGGGGWDLDPNSNGGDSIGGPIFSDRAGAGGGGGAATTGTTVVDPTLLGGAGGLDFGGGTNGGKGGDYVESTGMGENGEDGGDGLTGGGGGGGGSLAAFGDPGERSGDGGDGGDFGGGGSGSIIFQGNADSPISKGGLGGFGGGGGAGGDFATEGFFSGDGGNGGFGGGGGGTGFGADRNAFPPSIPGISVGGFGGDGGKDVFSFDPSVRSFGGSGGGGAGLGGALFLQNGANCTIEGSCCFLRNSAVGGPPGGTSADTVIAATAGRGEGQDIFMMSDATLTFNCLFDIVIPTHIRGDIGTGGGSLTGGGLFKEGPGLLALTGENTYSGKTVVSAGELFIDSSIITPVEVKNGGLLTGNFTLASSAVPNSGDLTNSGTVCPGRRGLGTIVIDGDYKQNASGRLIIDLTPTGQSDRISLTAGNAMLDGTLELVFDGGNYIAGTTYEIIDAPTNMTEFTSVVKTGPEGGNIAIDIDYSSVIITILTQRLFVDQMINSGPPSAVVDCMRSANIIPGSDFANVIEILGMLNNNQVNKALTSLSPVQFGALEWINARNNSLIADILSQHTFELCCSPRNCCCNGNVWATVFGNIMHNKKRIDNLYPFNADAVGALVGVDFCNSCGFYYGGSVGYAHTHLNWKTPGGHGDSNSYFGALYGSWQWCCLIFDFSAIGGGCDHDLKRKIAFSSAPIMMESNNPSPSCPNSIILEEEVPPQPVFRKAKSDPWSYFFTGRLGIRGQWCCGCSTFEPYSRVDYHYFHRNSFKEKGADSLNLSVRSKDQHMLRGETGVIWYYNVDCCYYCYTPYLGISWVGEFPLHKSQQKASFKGQSCVIDVTSYDSSIQLGAPQAGVKWSHCSGASILLGYKGLFNNKTQIHQIEGRLEWVF